MSPTERSIAPLRKQGWLVEVVERWMPGGHRKDLYGCIDLLALREGETMAVQVTSVTNTASRVKKIRSSPALGWMQRAHWTIHVHGWSRTGELKVIDVSALTTLITPPRYGRKSQQEELLLG